LYLNSRAAAITTPTSIAISPRETKKGDATVLDAIDQ
jgi:hypothetical protein